MFHHSNFLLQGSGGAPVGGCATITGNTITPIPDVGDRYSNDDSVRWPVSIYYNYAVTMFIIDSSELGGAKQLTGLEFLKDYRPAAASHTISNMYCKIAHTTDSILPSGTLQPGDDVSLSSMSSSNVLTSVSDETLVYNSNWFITSADNVWEGFSFSSNFCYNGTDNLVVLLYHDDGSYTSYYNWWAVDETSAASNNRGGGNRSDYDRAYEQTFTRKNERPCVRFNY